MSLQGVRQGKPKVIALSVLSGIGITILSLSIGIILDYSIVQIQSQYFLLGCSEDCYFTYFNAIFYVIVFLSLMVGFAGGRRTHSRLAERAK